MIEAARVKDGQKPWVVPTAAQAHHITARLAVKEMLRQQST
jgi:hypothetical protein